MVKKRRTHPKCHLLIVKQKIFQTYLRNVVTIQETIHKYSKLIFSHVSQSFKHLSIHIHPAKFIH